MPNIDLIHGDCMEYMATLPDKAFELAIVDPPYGIGANKEKPHNGWRDYGIKEWDNKIPPKEYFSELFRVSKNQIIWGGNYFTEFLQPTSHWLLWDKGQREFSLADGELAWCSFNKALRIFMIARAKIIQDGRIHPTQKPVALYQWLLKNYAKQGDKILDTHLGSGSSAIAADIMGFDFVGLEIDKDYYEAALDRFNRHKQQQVMVF
jgi:site-specific DNA-methyltransferase (adenine-specific)